MRFEDCTLGMKVRYVKDGYIGRRTDWPRIAGLILGEVYEITELHKPRGGLYFIKTTGFADNKKFYYIAERFERVTPPGVLN